jgi:hypothetical protein
MSTPKGFRMSRSLRDQVHGIAQLWEDLELVGGSSWQGQCLCGYVTRHCSTRGVAVGLLRRHGVLSGRRR